MFTVLESVQQPDQPRCFGSGEDISFDKNVLDL